MNAPFVKSATPYRAFSASRVAAMIMRYTYLLRSSWPRVLEIVYWPLVTMIMWGFLQTYLNQQSGFLAAAGGTLIGAILLWDVVMRGQLGFSISFLEEMWSRNMANLLMSPLTRAEFLLSLMSMSVIRLLISTVPVTLLAIAFFGFNLWSLGIALGAFFANLLITGWAVGTVVSGLVLRNGLGAEGFAWTIMFFIMPLCAVFYPVATLPAFIRPLSWALPPTYVFEGMRALMVDGTFRGDLMLGALGINIVYLAVAVFTYVKLLDSARRNGSLLAIGE